MSITESLIELDRKLFLFFNSTIANPFFDVIFTKGTEFTFWIIPGIIVLTIFVFRKRSEALIVIGLALLTVAVTDQFSTLVLKPLFHRARPCHPDLFVHGGRFLSGMRNSLSFPSVHAVNVFAQAALLSCFYPRLIWLYALFAFFIGFSRIYIGVHYPADVAGGAIVGIAAGIGVFLLFGTVKNRFASGWFAGRKSKYVKEKHKNSKIPE